MPNNDLQILYRRLKIEQHEPHYNQGMNSGAPDGNVVPDPYVIPSKNSIIQFIYLSDFILNYNNTHTLGIETQFNKKKYRHLRECTRRASLEKKIYQINSNSKDLTALPSTKSIFRSFDVPAPNRRLNFPMFFTMSLYDERRV